MALTLQQSCWLHISSNTDINVLLSNYKHEAILNIPVAGVVLKDTGKNGKNK